MRLELMSVVVTEIIHGLGELMAQGIPLVTNDYNLQLPSTQSLPFPFLCDHIPAQIALDTLPRYQSLNSVSLYFSFFLLNTFLFNFHLALAAILASRFAPPPSPWYLVYTICFTIFVRVRAILNAEII